MRAAVLVLALGLALPTSCKRDRATTQRSATPKPALAVSQVGQLKDGDLIFHESRSNQSEMVRALTDSHFTHMGVVFKERGGAVVLEAVSPVKKTALEVFIARGSGGRYRIKRLRDEARLGPKTIEKMRALGDSWLGRPYDLRFRWDDQSLYCSELAYKLFDRAAGVQLGKLQTAADMNLADERVQRALRKRFADLKFDPRETVVTPDAIFHDPNLIEVEL